MYLFMSYIWKLSFVSIRKTSWVLIIWDRLRSYNKSMRQHAKLHYQPSLATFIMPFICWCFVLDPSHVIQHKHILQDYLTYEEQPLGIIDCTKRTLRNKTILLVKLHWWYHGVEKCTWEKEVDRRDKYHPSFSELWISRTKLFQWWYDVKWLSNKLFL